MNLRWFSAPRTVAALVVGVPICWYGYDRYETRRIRNTLMFIASRYGEAPLAADQLPPRVTILAEGIDKNSLSGQREMFMENVQPILTAGGIEYEWMEASVRSHVSEARRAGASEIQPTDIEAYFSNIWQWRIQEWLRLEFEARRRFSKSGEASFFSHLWSWGKSSETRTNVLQEVGNRNQTTNSPVSSDGVSTMENPVELTALRAKHALLPHNPGLAVHQQGVLMVGFELFRSVLDSYRHSQLEDSRLWSELFGTFPARLGLLPYEPSEGIVSSVWSFFNHRKAAQELGSLALGIVTDQYVPLESSNYSGMVALHGNTSRDGLRIVVLHSAVVPGL